MFEELQKRIASHRREMLDLTRALISIPTENPPGTAYQDCARLLRARLSDLGLDLDSQPSAPFIQGLYGRGKRTLYFHGHFDVVPAAQRAQFRPVVRDGKLFGRGAADMKSGLVSMIYAVRAIQECGVKLDGRIALTLVPDEETGGARGTHALVARGALDKNSAGMITAEPTSGVIWNASRGAISLCITVRGKAAHAGLAHSGCNAFEAMMQVAQDLLKLKKQVASRKTRFAIRPDAARRSILLVGGRLSGGTNFNVVPAECSFTIDRRTNPEEDLAAEKRRLLEVLERRRHLGVNLTVELLRQGEASATRQNHALSRALAESVRQATGKAPRFEMCPGLLETRFFARKGIPALAYGPGMLSVSHGPREFVRIENMYDCALVYALTAVKLLGVS